MLSPAASSKGSGTDVSAVTSGTFAFAFGSILMSAQLIYLILKVSVLKVSKPTLAKGYECKIEFKLLIILL